MERLHIAFFGPTNSGKSTLVNAIAGQQVSLVSPVPGTTTDPVRKPIELLGLGPCVLIDTAGLDDNSVLGPERRRMALSILEETDVAVYVPPMSPKVGQEPQKEGEIAIDVPELRTSATPFVIYRRGESVESLLQRIAAVRPTEEQRFLTGNLVKAGDTVLLVMPQDSEAPQGRLILPQVQVIRELLDRGCTPLCCTPQSMPAALASLRTLPALTITDASVFRSVNELLPPEAPLTAFSVLLAAAKGDMQVFVEGAQAIDRLTPQSRVLIAEACTHVPDTEDIGRVKIPELLRRRICSKSERNSGRGLEPRAYFSERDKTRSCEASETLTISISAGNDFPEDLSSYDLIIHCGACMASRTLVRARIKKALLAGVPITNYGIALAKLQGLLDRIAIPDRSSGPQTSQPSPSRSQA